MRIETLVKSSLTGRDQNVSLAKICFNKCVFNEVRPA